MIKLMSTSEGAQDQETVQEKLLIENEDLSLPTENIDSIIETETNIFESCLLKLDIPECLTLNRE